ncbi:MAG: nitroreductase family protein [Deltaproteobacteria bacterium]
MTFLDLVRQRGSTRRFDPRPVAREALERCIEAARLAPSACNSQPWRFFVVDEPALKDALTAAAFGGPYAMNAFARPAGALVAVAAEPPGGLTRMAGWLRKAPFYLMDIGAAAEHFILQATEEGLGTCWIGWFDEKAVRRLLKLPAGSRICCLIAVGHPAGAPAEKTRKPAEAIRQFNA